MKAFQAKDRAILVGIGLQAQAFGDIKESLVELEELAVSAGIDVVGSVAQTLPKFNPATLIGSGKVLEIQDMANETEANLVVVDHHLSGVQVRNLEQSVGRRVIDRTQLILDIFAKRALSHEGKLQVQLAQLLDANSRMVGAWHGSLSRTGGGIGTQGPGEKAIEIDRRTIKRRIQHIKKELEDVRQNRQLHRQHRRRNQVPSCALIGYTNSGKSTLMNTLTNAQVQAEDRMFATLDPTTRKLYLPEGPPATLTDTVGFIRKLPPNLIEAFKATLEEAAEAEVLLHVIDLSSPQMDQQIRTVSDLINEFGWDKKPIIYVFNKVDVAPADRLFKINYSPRVLVSALTGEGMDRLKSQIADTVKMTVEEVELFFPNGTEHRIYELGRETHIMRQEQGSQGILCYAYLTPSLITKWKDFLVKTSTNPKILSNQNGKK